MEVPVSYQEISHRIEKSISKIETAVLSALEQTPPELYADIVRNGICLPAAVPSSAVWTSVSPTRSAFSFMWPTIPCFQWPRGYVALKNIDKFSFLIR